MLMVLFALMGVWVSAESAAVLPNAAVMSARSTVAVVREGGAVVREGGGMLNDKNEREWWSHDDSS